MNCVGTQYTISLLPEGHPYYDDFKVRATRISTNPETWEVVALGTFMGRDDKGTWGTRKGPVYRARFDHWKKAVDAAIDIAPYIEAHGVLAADAEATWPLTSSD